MNIVFLRSNAVAPDSRVEKEVKALLDDGHNVEIFGWDRSENYKVQKNEIKLFNQTTNIYRVGIKSIFGSGFFRNIFPLIKFQIQIFRWLRTNRNKVDVIHACDFDTAFTGFIVSKLLNKKIVYDIFDYYVDAFNVPSYLKFIIERIDKYIINNVDAVIICSEKRREQIRNTTPKYLEVIHNSPPKSEIKFHSKLNNNNVKVCYVGILQENRFLKEITEVIINKDNVEFHVGGFGKYEEFFKNISNNYHNIFFHGKLPYTKTLELEQECDILVAIYNPEIPNHKYAAPNKFYEALMLGKPIIMAKDTGLDDVVSDNEIGEVIQYNPVEFSVALDKLILNRNKWTEISTKTKIIYNNFSWEAMENKLKTLYKTI